MPTATWQPLAAVPDEPLNASGRADAALAEAARYAVLRRMGSAIRHQIAGALQPVGMLSSMLERRVQGEQPNMDALRKNCGEMSKLTRSASAECVALMGWIAPPHEAERVALANGVDECVHLLATEFSFRGFTLASTLEVGDAPVDRTTLRVLLPACLMALTDNAATGGEVQLHSHLEGAAVRLSMEFVASPAGGPAPTPAKAYRPLGWDDVRALALDHGIGLQIEPGGVSLLFTIGQHDLGTPPTAWH